jgi:hypothetical protein
MQMLNSFCSAKELCSVDQIVLSLKKQYENYCNVNIWSFVKLTMTCNRNFFKADEQWLYNKLSSMKKWNCTL